MWQRFHTHAVFHAAHNAVHLSDVMGSRVRSWFSLHKKVPKLIVVLPRETPHCNVSHQQMRRQKTHGQTVTAPVLASMQVAEPRCGQLTGKKAIPGIQHVAAIELRSKHRS